MWRNAHNRYLEERILSADPIELVEILYQAAITAVGDARRYLAEGEILARARSVSKACDILMELNTALDHARGGEISMRLAQLYGYMHRRLVEGNFRQIDQPFAEVSGLMTTLLEGWAGVRAAVEQPAIEQPKWTPALYGEPELTHASGSWSF